eukprot:gnl/TRDRNA2_/TRDRNA2_201302_c0_seq1.p1 gnl/TRDRNA2_/TRDRNA2_201302_c0~~gnl/TRDRNA2_/TRDRNA2_201302_c0_seq1.p1  ORF type:complete len:126 (+),score=4.56 gnl/TRDRNA2_/TRDRNA2_201302_c0_seq1:42-419(+)
MDAHELPLLSLILISLPVWAALAVLVRRSNAVGAESCLPTHCVLTWQDNGLCCCDRNASWTKGVTSVGIISLWATFILYAGMLWATLVWCFVVVVLIAWFQVRWRISCRPRVCHPWSANTTRAVP